MRAIAIGQHPDQRVGVAQMLPGADDLRAVLHEQLDFLLTEPLVEFVDAALELTDAIAARIRRVHPQLEAAWLGVDVPRQVLRELGFRSARRRRSGGRRLAAAGRRLLRGEKLQSETANRDAEDQSPQ